MWKGCEYLPIVLQWLTIDGQPFDLTGWVPHAQSRNMDLNAVVTDAAKGLTQISLTFTETSMARLGVEPWDWIWIGPDGKVYPPILFGTVPIKEPNTLIVQTT